MHGDVDGFPFWKCAEMFIIVFLRQEVIYVLNETLSNFRQNSRCLTKFLNLVDLLGWVKYNFSNGLGCHMSYESLGGFWELEPT